MHIESQNTVWWQGGLLLLATPFLIFPTLWPVGTFLALIATVIIWLTISPPSTTPFHIPLILFGLMVIIGVLVTADPDLTLPKATGIILGCTSWYVLIKMVHTQRHLYISLAIFLIIALGFSALGALSTNWVFKVPLFQQVVSLLPSDLVALPDSPDSGVQANQLAGTILIFWPLLLSLFIGRRIRNLPAKIILGLSILFFTLLLILTQSRSGWLGGIGGVICLLIWWGWLRLPPRQRWWLCLGLALLGAVAISGALWIGPEHWQELWIDPAQETVIGSLGGIRFRQEVWRWAVEAVKSFSFTGTGLGTYRRVAVRLFPLDVPTDYDISHAHNMFLQAALDIGLPGLVAYMALLLVAGATGWRVAQRNESLQPFAIGLVGGLVALHIYGLTDALALGSKTGLLFWLVLGNLAALPRVAAVDSTEINT